MQVGDFILTKGNGLTSEYFCICRLLDDSRVQTLSAGISHKFYMEDREYNSRSCLKSYFDRTKDAKVISLEDPDFHIALTTHTIREDCKAELAAFLKALVNREIQGGKKGINLK